MNHNNAQQDFDMFPSHMRTVEWALQHGRSRAGLPNTKSNKQRSGFIKKMLRFGD